jgi:histidine ammonia-lyase
MLSLANFISTVSLEAFDGRPEPFDALLHKVRNHHGQSRVAADIRGFLKGSELIKRKKQHVQDPYSLGCIPQVHGASADALQYLGLVLETEINSVTDNPIVFPDENKILSGGNFHGQPLALALDFACIALAELGSIAERRIFLLLSGQRNLPPFLVHSAETSGLNSGLMIAQYTAASIVSENKQLCTPASVDSITSSNGQEDHVSMGANAATKALRVLENLKTILSIELFNAAQGLDFQLAEPAQKTPLRTSPEIEKFLTEYRNHVPFLSEDRIFHDDIAKTRNFLFS